MSSRVRRVAFLVEVKQAYIHWLASGICRFANPAHGFITREFIVGERHPKLPHAFENWEPDAAICYIGAEHEELLTAIGAGGRPVVNTSRGQPKPGRGVVLGDAQEVYDVILSHFRQRKLEHVAQYVFGELPSSHGTRERYRQYAEEHAIPFHSFTTEEAPKHDGDWSQFKQIDNNLADWLRSLPKPVGIFSQQDGAGSYLCRACRQLGLKVPEEVAVVCSDPFDVAMASTPPLTAVRLPGESIGYAAAELVAAMLDGQEAPDEMVRIRGLRLIVRESTGGAKCTGCNIDAALEFIMNNACDGIKVNDIVSHTQSVSRMTFHKRFVEKTGMTPAAAIQRRRMSEARRLLSQTRLSIGTIAGMCGYFDDLYFSQVFRKVEGVSPRQYRRMQVGS